MKQLRWHSDDLGATFDQLPLEENLLPEANRWREKLIEALADEDDALAEAYLAGKEITPEQIRAALRPACLQGRLVPVLCGSALRNKGIQPLLDAVVDFLPSPLDLPPVEGTDPRTGEKVLFERVRDAPFSGLAFKVQLWEGRKHTYLRIFSGSLGASDTIFNASKGVEEKIARLLKLHADKKERISRAQAGDIVGVVGLKAATTGDTLCTRQHPVVYERIQALTPVISLAVEPKSSQDEEKLKETLAKMAEEDPTFIVSEDAETGQILLNGMGELHLEIICDRLQREFHLPVNVGKPQAVRRETLAREAEVAEEFERTFEEAGQPRRLFAGISLRGEPGPRGSGVIFVNGFQPPPEKPSPPVSWLEEAELGVREAAASGPATGYPLTDMKVILLEIRAREGETTPVAIHIAAAAAMRRLAERAGTQVLLPVMSVEIVTPDEFTGTVIGDMNARGGRVEGIEKRPTRTLVRARVPVTAMFGYSTDLRSLTEGRATFSMQFREFGAV